jgi:uncharacterized protein
MFESPAAARPLVTLDPWSVEYGSAMGFDDEETDEETSFEVDPFVETEDWSDGRVPAPIPLPASVAFVDGVQRVEYWARVDDGDVLAEAAFASVAVGAVVSRAGQASMTCEYTQRVFAVGGPVAAQPIVVYGGGRELVYEVSRSDEGGQRAVYQAIAVRRRDLEHACVQRMLQTHPLVIADGRLDRPEVAENQLAGIAKTLHQLYLKGEQRALISRLQAGRRTPVFRIADSWGARYSWFLRLPYTRSIHHSYAGIVRLEVPVAGARAPTDVADMLTHNLPRFASRPEHDPRAPQNLLPVGALEKRLRHDLGEVAYIRRMIEDCIARGGVA